MIFTLTLNPSIDYLIKSDKIKLGELNRSDNGEFVIGGKGINVSLMLNNLEIKSQATGFISGFTGDYINSELSKYKYIKNDFFNLKNNEITRINIKLKTNESETEINNIGCEVTNDDFEYLKNYILKLNKCDTFILSGSLAKGLDEKAYCDLAKIFYQNSINFVVDSTKNNLLKTLKYKPLLIKPNINELKEIFNTNITTDNEIILYAKKLQSLGSKNVLVSMGERGAILLTKENTYKVKPIKINPISTVGAGDSMVAGFIAEYNKSKNYIEALKLGTACSIATSLSTSVGSLKEVEKYLKLIEIEEV